MQAAETNSNMDKNKITPNTAHNNSMDGGQ